MLRKQSIAVYSPENAIEKVVQKTYHAIKGRWTTMGETLGLIESLIAYDGLYDSFLSHPEAILRTLFADSDSGKICVPCHVVELRQILRKRKIVSNYKIAALKWHSAVRYFTEYPVLIVLDEKKIPDVPICQLGGLTVFDKVLHCGSAIVRVMCRDTDYLVAQAINEIVQDEYPTASSHPLTEIPGTSLPKAAKRTIVFKLAQSPSNQIPINLTPQEKQIFDFLLAVNQKYQLGLTFRVAGGWVRDKAIGKESDDIDIALDKMTGGEFGKYLAKEIGKAGNVIKANPDQSKHLETMTVNLFGQDIDFVNLRSETYGDSRIPDMSFGTPEVDAFRRDLTINSLFYNVNTESVEDFTGKGISDLGFENGQKTGPLVLRTPLDPKQTFLDDPLRIMRLIRFYSRYPDSKIDQSAIDAIKQPQVLDALKNKVSPERIFTEWNKMFSGKQPANALRVLYESGIWQSLFAEKHMPGFHPFTMDQKNKHHTDNVFEHTLKVVENYQKILDADNAGEDERARLLAAAFMHDLGKLDPSIITVKDTAEGIFQQYIGHEDVSARVTRAILEGLKASNEEIEMIETVVARHMEPHQHNNSEMSDKQLRKMVRELGRNLVRRIIQHAKADAISKPGEDGKSYDKLLERATTIEQLENKKPVLSGQILMQMFPNLNPKSGFMTHINALLRDMKDENPNLSEQECIGIIESQRMDIESRFGVFADKPRNRQRPVQKQPNTQPPVQPQQPQPKTAQTWYEQMKSMGERPSTAGWTCGVVSEKPRYPGSDNDSTDVILKTATNELSLKFNDGKEYDDPELQKLIGKSICCKGLRDGLSFVISEYSINEDEKPRGEKKMQRYKTNQVTKFEKGDKVRHRRRGLAFKQIDGTVDEIKDGLIFIKWQGIEDPEVFKLTDTVALHSLLEKI